MERLESYLGFIAAKPTGEEIGFCRERTEMDIELGDTNDFELRLSLNEWSEGKYGYGNRIFVPDTEYGGIIEDMEVFTSSNEIALRGATWRGMLERKVVEPPDGSTHLVLSGELNQVLRELIGERFGSFFVVPVIDTGVEISNWQVDRYVTLYDAMIKLLDSVGYRLNIAYCQPTTLEYGYVTVQAVPVADYSEYLEYSQDGNVLFAVRDYRGGINHLVCAGKGEAEDRDVLHLYVRKDGSIGKTQYYYGLDERAAVYEYTSAEDETKLEESGTERLKELQNYKQIEISLDEVEMDLEIGDIVGGYEQVTKTLVQKPIVGKILTISDGKTHVEYKVKGDD